jgi:hypothetical protein
MGVRVNQTRHYQTTVCPDDFIRIRLNVFFHQLDAIAHDTDDAVFDYLHIGRHRQERTAPDNQIKGMCLQWLKNSCFFESG